MENSFEKIYQELCEHNDLLIKAKKERNQSILKFAGICGVILLIIGILDKQKYTMVFAIAIALIFILLKYGREDRKFRKLYKELIIKKMVQTCNKELDFSSEGKISQYDYSVSHFDNSYDELYSEDKIYGRIKENCNFQMAQITTKEIRREVDSEGKTTTEHVETFRGLYGMVELDKSSEANIYIAQNSIIQKYSSKRIEMDSAEFEQNYDCLTKDKITAMKIFTADLLEKFVNLKREKINGFQMKIENQRIYFRIACGEVFEPPRMKDTLDKNLMKKYYNLISLPIELIEEIIQKIKEL